MKSYGAGYWWPAPTPLEVIEGAVLTQNTSWRNTQKALDNLRGKSCYDILGLSSDRLIKLIRPAGFFHNKEKYIRAALEYYERKIESLSLPYSARDELMSLKGIGKETADSIALFSFHGRTVPVDSYTLRLLNRYFGSSYTPKDYEVIRESFAKVLNSDSLMEFHAVIDEHCKRVCKKRPDCGSCPLNESCRKMI